ncbi:testis-expressed protein 47-like [Aquarana catesbeiana]|uniref:testis-expressed protein 47-like n=1 Tax=Aquarana catesbeiana TaxID=8400 RepID=UPI003CC9E7BC
MASHHRRLSTPGFPYISALTAVLETQHMKSVNHRLFYAAKISPEGTNYKDFTDHCDKLFKKLLKSNLGESITGLLLIYPTCVIHIIESSSEILFGIIQDLAHIQRDGVNSLLREARILVISHNISSRLFQQWNYHRMRLQSNDTHVTQNQSEEEVAEKCFTTLLKLGIFLSEILQPGSKGPEEDLHGLAPELCVQEETIHFLLKSDRFLKPEEFLGMYDRPVNVSILSDQLWPASQHFYL